MIKRERTELVATVSHAMGTRIAALAAVLESLQKTALDSKQLEYLQTMAEFNRSLSSLVNVLNASESETGQLEMEKRQFAPLQVLADVALLVQPLAESKGLSLRIDLTDTKSLQVTGDMGKICDALLSLAHDAVRFTDAGFTELRVWRAEPDRIGFEVKDSGSGIPIHIRGGSWRHSCVPTARRGIGLADGAWLGIAKRLVESMAGELEMESAIGLGTTVRFSLNMPPCDQAISLGMVASTIGVPE